MAALDFILNRVQLNGTDPLDTSKFIHMDDFATLLTSISEYPCGVDIIEKVDIADISKTFAAQVLNFRSFLSLY